MVVKLPLKIRGMIKLFRNIRKNLLAEGKSSRYLKYAIGEIILVVIGILIALQINNWNEHRKLKQIEIKLVQQLLEDAKADSIFFESRQLFQKKRDTMLDNFISLSRGIRVDSIYKLSNAPLASTPFHFRLAYQSNLITNNPNAYDLVSDKNIQTTLRDYKMKYDYVKESIELSNQTNETYGLPLNIKYNKYLMELKDQQTYSDYDFMLKDEETIGKLNIFKDFAINSINQIEKFLVVNDSLIGQLQDYLILNK